MEGSSDFSNDDIWSPSLREELFSDYNLGQSWDSNVNDLFLPRLSCLDSTSLDRPVPADQQWGVNTNIPTSTISSLPNTTPQARKPSHLDLPNFPLPTEYTAASSNPSARPPPPSSNHVPQPQPQPQQRTTTPQRPRNLPRSPTLFDSDGESSHSNTSFTGSSSDSESPWSDSDQDSSGFVDLTQDASPPTMPPVRRPPPHRSPGTSQPQRRNALRASTSRRTSAVPSNPAKRRKIGAGNSEPKPSQPSQSQKAESIDLTGVDDDATLSKVLEQQRMALIKTQQEEARKPVKLSTVQCIICMENMKDLTATSCGHLFCHSCLMEALIAGENQGMEPGKGVPKCPVCRKKVIRPLPTDKRDRRDVVPLAMKLRNNTKSIVRKGKGKGKAVD